MHKATETSIISLHKSFYHIIIIRCKIVTTTAEIFSCGQPMVQLSFVATECCTTFPQGSHRTGLTWFGHVCVPWDHIGRRVFLKQIRSLLLHETYRWSQMAQKIHALPPAQSTMCHLTCKERASSRQRGLVLPSLRQHGSSYTGGTPAYGTSSVTRRP